MFQLDKPNMLEALPETKPVLEYLWKAAEYMNMALNAIDPKQIDGNALARAVKEIIGTPAENAPGIFQAFVRQTTATEDVTTDDGTMSITLNLRKYMGLVFVHVGPTMSNIPVNDTTDLNPVPAIYRPMKQETMDWTDPDGDRYRLSIYANGNVKIHNYGSTLKSSIVTNIHMAFPAATL